MNNESSQLANIEDEQRRFIALIERRAKSAFRDQATFGLYFERYTFDNRDAAVNAAANVRQTLRSLSDSDASVDIDISPINNATKHGLLIQTPATGYSPTHIPLGEILPQPPQFKAHTHVVIGKTGLIVEAFTLVPT